ncbi:MAG: N-acetylglucosamine-6-phosphate deacetylase [Candidatus Promineifilaceae bacterium]
MLVIRGATIVTPDGRLEEGDLRLAAGRIQALGRPAALDAPPGAPAIAAAGHILAPGLLDLQLNGGFGHDFSRDPASIWAVAARLPELGVTGFTPTLVSPSPERVAQAQAVLAAGPPAGWRGARPLGLHLEGPYLNPAKRGAHPAAALRPPPAAEGLDWSPQTGVRLVTLAPELPGALALTAALVERGLVVAAGHSAASFDEGRAAIAAGVRYATHLFNAMPPLHQRQPGLVGALLDDERVTLGLIADGQHVHPAMIRFLWRAAAGRINLVSDAMAALGRPAGNYPLGEQTANLQAGAPTRFGARGEPLAGAPRLANGVLAGSARPLAAGLKNLLAWTGCAPAEALAAVTTTPARLLGLEGAKGRLAAGHDADLVLLTPQLEVALALVSGEVVFDRLGQPARAGGRGRAR